MANYSIPKRRGRSSSLIAGEAYSRKTRGIDTGGAGGAFETGMEAANKSAEQAVTNRRLQQNHADAEMKGYIDSLSNEYNLANLNKYQQQSVTNFLVEQKRRYANAAMLASKMRSTNPAYVQYRDIMNGVNSSFESLANNLENFKKHKLMYSDAIENNNISRGVDPENRSILNGMYKGDSIMRVDENGSLMFEVEGQFTYFNDMPKYYTKDYKAADAVLKIANQLYTSKSKLTGGRENLVRNQILNLVSSGGRQTIMSLAQDSLVAPGGLGVIPPELLKTENETDLVNWVVDSYMNVMRDTALSGYNDARVRTSSSGSSDKRPSETNAQRLDRINQEAVWKQIRSKKDTIEYGSVRLVKSKDGQSYVIWKRDSKGNWNEQLTGDLPSDSIDKWDNSALSKALELDPWSYTDPVNKDYEDKQ